MSFIYHHPYKNNTSTRAKIRESCTSMALLPDPVKRYRTSPSFFLSLFPGQSLHSPKRVVRWGCLSLAKTDSPDLQLVLFPSCFPFLLLLPLFSLLKRFLVYCACLVPCKGIGVPASTGFTGFESSGFETWWWNKFSLFGSANRERAVVINSFIL